MSTPRPIRVIVGEDQPFVRERIVRVLLEGGFDVVGTAADARELHRMADAYHPDVIIADIQMPPDHTDDGLRAALAIRAARPGVGVLVLSAFLDDAYAFALVADGAQGVGYLLKEKVGDLRTFTDSARRVADGGSVLDPDVVARLVGRTRKAGPLDDLTPRERQVLGLIAEGRSNAGIATELVVTGCISRPRRTGGSWPCSSTSRFEARADGFAGRSGLTWRVSLPGRRTWRRRLSDPLCRFVSFCG